MMHRLSCPSDMRTTRGVEFAAPRAAKCNFGGKFKPQVHSQSGNLSACQRRGTSDWLNLPAATTRHGSNLVRVGGIDA